MDQHTAGVLLTAVLAGGAGVEGVARALSCVEPALADRCRQALAELSALPRPERRRRVIALTRRVLSPCPDGVDLRERREVAALLHGQPPALVAGALEALPASLRAQLTAPASDVPAITASQAVRRRLCQRLLAPLAGGRRSPAGDAPA